MTVANQNNQGSEQSLSFDFAHPHAEVLLIKLLEALNVLGAKVRLVSDFRVILLQRTGESSTYNRVLVFNHVLTRMR